MLFTGQSLRTICCNLGHFQELLVLDEADKLLDFGFEKSLNTILQYLPSQRRTGLFSATQTKQLISLVKAGLRNPVLIEVKEKKMKMPDRYKKL